MKNCAYTLGMAIFVCMNVLPFNVVASDFFINQSFANDLGRTYGFIVGQDITLERIKKKYPELSNSVMHAELEFKSAFPDIKIKLIEQLTKIFGDDKFRNKMENDILQIINQQQISKNIAQNFLREMKERSKGNIQSPVIETMLLVQYHSQPIEEFIDGFRQRFNSKGHLKSQGLEIVLQLPISWKGIEGERPHIVKKWKSQNGNGLELIMLDIRDADGSTGDDMQELVRSGDIIDIVPNGFEYINSGVITIEKQRGYWLETSGFQERTGIEMYQHSIQYQLFFRGKGIGLSCNVIRLKEEKNIADERFREIKPLCLQVLNSMVLLQAY